MQIQTCGVLFNNTERRLLLLFYSGSISETINTLRQAFSDIFDSGERAIIGKLITKLYDMDDAVLADFMSECEGSYV